jgi:hypothetical protein
MDPPDPERLRAALAHLQDEVVDEAREALDRVLAEHPTGEVDPDRHDAEATSLEEKAWLCAGLARERLDEGKATSARVLLHSAVDHAEGEVEPDPTPDQGGVFGEEAIESALENLREAKDAAADPREDG